MRFNRWLLRALLPPMRDVLLLHAGPRADAGLEAKVRVLGSVSVVLSYGRDLRNGGGLFYVTSAR